MAIGDVNPKKHGLFTPKTGIPIISEEAMVSSANEDAVFIVLPWHFKRSIIKSLKHNMTPLLHLHGMSTGRLPPPMRVSPLPFCEGCACG